jgi:hypothetical protein
MDSPIAPSGDCDIVLGSVFSCHFAAPLAVVLSLSVLGCSGSRVTSGDGSAGGAAGKGGSSETAGAGGRAGTGGSAPGGEGGGGSTGRGGAGSPPLEPTRIRGGDANEHYYDLEIGGQGLVSLEGRVVTVRIGDPPLVRLASGQARVVGGSFSLTLPQVLEDGLYKTKIIHFDVDGDGRCGPGDQAWIDRSSSLNAPGLATRMFEPDGAGVRLSGSNVGAGVVSAPDAEVCRRIEICGPYDPRAEATRPIVDMKVAGSGLEAHERQRVRLLTRSRSTASLRGIGRGIVFGGRFTVYLPNGYERRADQEILWFVDVDGDGRCNASAGDHLGYATVAGLDPTGNDAVAVAVTDDHAGVVPGDVDVCAGMPPLSTMAVTGSGFAGHEGARMFFFTRTSTGAPLAGATTSVSATGGVFFSQRPYAYERNANQQVLWFLDSQGSPNVACDVTTGDHVGFLATGAFDPIGNEVVNLVISDNHVEMTTTAEDICAVMNGCR